VVVAIVATSGGGGKTRLPPPAHLAPLVNTYANQAIGVAGGVPSGWTAVRGTGFIQLASRDRKAIILIAAQNIASAGNLALLRAALASLSKTYGAYGPVTVKSAPRTKLSGLVARSAVVAARNRDHILIHIVVAQAGGRRLAYLLEAFTSRNASARDLAATVQIIAVLHLTG
jgi:hypothetical protein